MHHAVSQFNTNVVDLPLHNVLCFHVEQEWARGWWSWKKILQAVLLDLGPFTCWLLMWLASLILLQEQKRSHLDLKLEVQARSCNSSLDGSCIRHYHASNNFRQLWTRLHAGPRRDIPRHNFLNSHIHSRSTQHHGALNILDADARAQQSAAQLADDCVLPAKHVRVTGIYPRVHRSDCAYKPLSWSLHRWWHILKDRVNHEIPLLF